MLSEEEERSRARDFAISMRIRREEWEKVNPTPFLERYMGAVIAVILISAFVAGVWIGYRH
jgi:hypothetical protein